jgi:RNA polymerase sigma-70 factor, ECF subfamily
MTCPAVEIRGRARHPWAHDGDERGNKTSPDRVSWVRMGSPREGAGAGDDGLRGQDDATRFEDLFLPHLDAAFNLARWLTRDDVEAEEVVQEAFVRALRFFGGFRGKDGRAWLLAIVRNTCFGRMRSEGPPDRSTPFDEEIHGVDREESDPEEAVLNAADGRAITQALEELPFEFREVLVLREIEGLSYKEISGVTGVPTGTVMSRLSRARKRMQLALGGRLRKEV